MKAMKSWKRRKNHQSAWWEKILESQIETGTPYMLYKMLPTVNQTKEFRNDSFFKFMYWDMEYTSLMRLRFVIWLLSLCLLKTVVWSRYFFIRLQNELQNLNKVIDKILSVKETENSNMRHRPVGLGCRD
jgi:ribonucleoside-diphosphate reductase alpha chain